MDDFECCRVVCCLLFTSIAVCTSLGRLFGIQQQKHTYAHLETQNRFLLQHAQKTKYSLFANAKDKYMANALQTISKHNQ
mmetsp:Transcript_26690/g.42286  ORF Transcript_26690/g.42286 Transcript_26690/m.42286 type:complete len:80 (-) Transcript_26690:186-425(-)